MKRPTTSHLATIALALMGILACGRCSASVQIFESNAAGWRQAALLHQNVVELLSFDEISVAPREIRPMSPLTYADRRGNPVLSAAGVKPAYSPFLAVLNHRDSAERPSSLPNVFTIDDGSVVNQGILHISFGSPVFAIGADFIDVEGAHQFTGIQIGSDPTLHSISRNFGNHSKLFFGITSDEPFRTASIHFAATADLSVTDGVLVDDLVYALPIPEPSSRLICAAGVCASIGLRRRTT